LFRQSNIRRIYAFYEQGWSIVSRFPGGSAIVSKMITSEAQESPDMRHVGWQRRLDGLKLITIDDPHVQPGAEKLRPFYFTRILTPRIHKK
jgi:hypothetical protein